MTAIKRPSHLSVGLVVFFILVGLITPLVAVAVGGLPALAWVLTSQRAVLLNNAIWMVGGALGVVGGALGMAYLTFERPKLTRLLAVAILPVSLGASSVAIIWRLSFAFRPAYRSQVGIVNEAFTAVGLPSVSWLTQRPAINTVVLGASLVWVGASVAGLLLVHVGAEVPKGWINTARRYGATRPQRFRYLAWPLLRRPTVAVATVSTVFAWHAHTVVQVATSGSFGTSLAALEAWERIFTYDQTSRGLALALFITGVSALIVLVGAWLYHRSPLQAPQLAKLRRGGRRSAPPAEADLPENRLSWRVVGAVEGALLLGLIFVILLPILGVVITALTPQQQAETSGWWTNVGTFNASNVQNSLAGAHGTRGLRSAFVSSVVISVPVTAALVALGHLAARGLASMAHSLGHIGKVGLVGALLIPVAGSGFVAEWMLARLHLLGTYPGLWLGDVVVFAPLAILVSYFFWMNPKLHHLSITVCGVVIFVAVWNDFTMALTVLGNQGENLWPLPLEAARHLSIYGEAQAPLAASVLVASVVPALVAVIFAGPVFRALGRQMVSNQLDELKSKNRYDLPSDDQVELHHL